MDLHFKIYIFSFNPFSHLTHIVVLEHFSKTKNYTLGDQKLGTKARHKLVFTESKNINHNQSYRT